MGMNVQRIKRLSENTVFVTFSCHTDFRKAIRLLSIVAKDTREKVKPSKGSYYSRMAEYEKIFEEQFIASLERPYNEDGIVVNSRPQMGPIASIKIPLSLV